MIKIAIILFRECLEIALLLGIILAVTKKVAHSRFYITLGIMIGVLTASLVAFGLKYLTVTYFGLGAEIFDVIVIMTTVILIVWTIVWMQGYINKIKAKIVNASNGNTANLNSKSDNIILVLVVAMTFLREGVEIMLLLYSISTVDKMTINQYLVGVGIGIFSSLAVGVLLYNGLIGLANKYVFKISNIMLILIVAGLSAKAAEIITSASLIQGFNDVLWDSSWLISDNSALGRLLNAVIGYTAKPNLLQVIFYSLTIIIVIILTKWKSYTVHKALLN